jgi:hypothetical protein
MARKTIRRRKPLTEEQKAERRERLAKARANRPPPEYKSIHEAVSRDETHPWYVKNILSWIRSNKDEIASLKKDLKRNYDKKLNNRLNILESYVQNLETYLRTGTYLDSRWGPNMEHTVRSVVRAMAYHWYGPYKGMINRSVGSVYPDVGLWTQEMNDDYYGQVEIKQPTPSPKKTRRKKKAK